MSKEFIIGCISLLVFYAFICGVIIYKIKEKLKVRNKHREKLGLEKIKLIDVF